MNNIFITFLAVYYIPAYSFLLIRSITWRVYIKKTAYLKDLNEFYKAERITYLITVIFGVFIFLIRNKINK
jgi:hypothetical protein